MDHAPPDAELFAEAAMSWREELLQQVAVADSAELDRLLAVHRERIDALLPRDRERLLGQLADAHLGGKGAGDA
jgi:hypothetical protein